MHVFIKQRDLHVLKRESGRYWKEVTHSQACELLAAGLGHNTFASLNAALRDGPIVTSINEERINDRYVEFKPESDDLKLVANRKLREILWDYRCCSPLQSGKSDSTPELLGALAGWNGAPIAAFARVFDAAFWPEERPWVTTLEDGREAIKASVGFRGAHAPIMNCVLHAKGTFPVVPGDVMEIEVNPSSRDTNLIVDAVLYVERFARETRSAIVFVGDALSSFIVPETMKPSLAYWLECQGYHDVTGLWGRPDEGNGESPVMTTLIKSYCAMPRTLERAA